MDYASRLVNLANEHANSGSDYVIGDLESAIHNLFKYIPEESRNAAFEEARQEILERQGKDLEGDGED